MGEEGGGSHQRTGSRRNLSVKHDKADVETLRSQQQEITFEGSAGRRANLKVWKFTEVLVPSTPGHNRSQR